MIKISTLQLPWHKCRILQLQPSRYPHKQTSWLPSGSAYVRFPGKQVVQCSLSHTHFLTRPLASYTSNYCLDHKHSLLYEILDELIVLILSLSWIQSLVWWRCLSSQHQHCCESGGCPSYVSFSLAWWKWPWRWHWQGLHDLTIKIIVKHAAPPEMEAYLARHFDKEVMVSQSST